MSGQNKGQVLSGPVTIKGDLIVTGTVNKGVVQNQGQGLQVVQGVLQAVCSQGSSNPNSPANGDYRVYGQNSIINGAVTPGGTDGYLQIDQYINGAWQHLFEIQPSTTDTTGKANVLDLFISGRVFARDSLLSAPGRFFFKAKNSPFSSNPVYAIAYGNGVFVAGGATNAQIARSTDSGVTWGSLITNPLSGILEAIAYGNGVFVAGTNSGKIARSTDYGVTWGSLITNPLGGAGITAIAYGNGVFVVTCGGGQIARSTDSGVTWGSLITNPFGGSGIYAIAYGNGVFIAGTNNGKIARSTDGGVTWGSLITNPFGSANILGISYGNGVFVAVATGATGLAARSLDLGLTWGIQYGDNSTVTVLSTDLYAIATNGNGRFVAVGYDSSNISLAYSDYVEAGAGIVSNGSNSNGYYIQFADGTMEEWGISASVANTYSVTVTFPIPFINTSYSMNATHNGAINTGATDTAPLICSVALASAVIGKGQNSGNARSMPMYWHAIGRWK